MPELTKDRIGFDPGPWEVKKNAFITVNSANGNIVCGCGAMNYPSEWLIQKSLCNARLIKAAPDMYKMLNRFATYFKERGFNTPRTCTLPTPEEVCNLIDEIDGKEIVRRKNRNSRQGRGIKKVKEYSGQNQNAICRKIIFSMDWFVFALPRKITRQK